jgi:hypothetical protein
MARDAQPAPEGDRSIRPATAARVWLSRLGTAQTNEIEGSLSLTATELRFDHRRGADHEHVPLADIRKVKRPAGSPVLYVEYTKDGERVRLAFFFAQPPPVDHEASQLRSRRKRSDNAGFMWQQSGNVAGLVRSWRGALREAVKRARRQRE